MSYAYRLATLKLDSALELPDLTPWDEPGVAQSDIVFRICSVPQRLENPDHVGPVFQARGRDEYLLSLPSMGRILVRHGREVNIELASEADLIGTRSLLTGPIQAVLWHQRGLLPLHASVVVVGNRAVALAGPSAAGKSALAAVLARDGCEILADDVCVIEVSEEPRRATVLPGVTALRLWRDTIDFLGISPDGLRPVLSGKHKFFVDSRGGRGQPGKLAAVVVLAHRDTVALRIEPLHGPVAETALRRLVHARRAARALRRDQDAFATVTRLLGAGVTVWRISLPHDLAALRETAALVLSLLEKS
jgi:hypothetical protein